MQKICIEFHNYPLKQYSTYSGVLKMLAAALQPTYSYTESWKAERRPDYTRTDEGEQKASYYEDGIQVRQSCDAI